MISEKEMNVPNANQSAFPFLVPSVRDEGICSGGLTKREHIAAMQQIPWDACADSLELNHPELKGKVTIKQLIEYRAEIQVIAADALLAELDKTK